MPGFGVFPSEEQQIICEHSEFILLQLPMFSFMSVVEFQSATSRCHERPCTCGYISHNLYMHVYIYIEAFSFLNCERDCYPQRAAEVAMGFNATVQIFSSPFLGRAGMFCAAHHMIPLSLGLSGVSSTTFC